MNDSDYLARMRLQVMMTGTAVFMINQGDLQYMGKGQVRIARDSAAMMLPTGEIVSVDEGIAAGYPMPF